MATTRAALVSICHGAGPLPALQDPAHSSLVRSLSTDVRKLLQLDAANRPKAIALLTAHWQTGHPKISASRNNHLYYDYSGFPEEGYQIKYEAEGSPEVASRAHELLQQAGFKAELDSKRGWDHGTFIPMKIIAPEASIPIVQISILSSQKPDELLRMGRALAPLREENVAILGSGSPSFHDVRVWMSGRLLHDKSFAPRQAEWHTALEGALDQEGSDKRISQLEQWRDFPHSYEMHPRGAAEHFNTLLICAGAAGDAPVHCEKFGVMGAEQATCWWD